MQFMRSIVALQEMFGYTLLSSARITRTFPYRPIDLLKNLV